MIHNNHFFFKHLSPTTVAVPAGLQASLEQSFGSMDTLRKEMVDTATSMFGPGFVWLVKTSQMGLPTAYKVLATYAAGSPYPGAHWRRQTVDMNTAAGEKSGPALENARRYIDSSAAAAGNRANAAAAKLSAPGGTDLQPLLCLNTWEHVWLWDYSFGLGQRGGKQAYAEAWWNKINWDLVYKEANIQRRMMSA
jgi:Fe-Mn family superoxide dismutase